MEAATAPVVAAIFRKSRRSEEWPLFLVASHNLHMVIPLVFILRSGQPETGVFSF
jgi:hypothetical protein